jgi:hypothetical protein
MFVGWYNPTFSKKRAVSILRVKALAMKMETRRFTETLASTNQ